jgi:hypothetical protein
LRINFRVFETGAQSKSLPTAPKSSSTITTDRQHPLTVRTGTINSDSFISKQQQQQLLSAMVAKATMTGSRVG